MKTLLNKFKQFFHPISATTAMSVPSLPVTWLSGAVSLTLRPLVVADLNQALAIERDVYDGKTPWDRLVFMNELSRQQDRLYLGLFTADDLLVGFIGAWFSNNETHVTNIALRRSWQQQGWGQRLMGYLIAVASARGCRIMTLEARVDNKNALALYRRLGFRDVRIRKNYYEQEQADAVSMRLELNSITKKNA
ncbi:ribosomal protein S18-alanine N-acetyltransferase [Lapidilactobacillus luobeiensis]|uniref:ribosomal protein S18-alanine N-acetyltransferase n=1 Tax=Lapidilactobacillus luobeiensis TaxID=2950371 RepID=UPI0021C4A089|nr:ribosomal protein S18-alanine N-acetyltransferase [Lapidilactobacillus luobeiensis]